MAAAFDEDALRGEVRSWLAGAWDPDLALVEWRSRLVEAGWARPSWPPGLGGRGLPPAAEGVVEDELGRAGAVRLPVGGGVGLAAPTILAHATDEQQRRFIPRTLTG
ncbi:MAG TPA: acyl-CoA dehydrogenase family protein, partial [Acidimicrobiales bacterium]|nr:acyl-CoA dehydrogenase family protein [Acidimicrobiales bacterium]